MKPDGNFPGANTRLVADGCQDLIAMRAHGNVYTVWRLSDEDRTKIAAGGVVHLAIMGNTQPPVRMSVESLDTSPGREDDPTVHEWLCPACDRRFQYVGVPKPKSCPYCRAGYTP